MIDARGKTSREDIKKRWKKLFKFYDLKAPPSGAVVISVDTGPRQRVYENDALFTIATSRFILGQTVDKPALPLKEGSLLELFLLDGTPAASVKLQKATILKDGSYQLHMEIVQDKVGIDVGVMFVGKILLLHKENILKVPAQTLYHAPDGKPYLIRLELVPVETGISDKKETEITGGAQAGFPAAMPDSFTGGGQLKKR
jgi:hypothetical protein